MANRIWKAYTEIDRPTWSMDITLTADTAAELLDRLWRYHGISGLTAQQLRKDIRKSQPSRSIDDVLIYLQRG